MLGSVCNDLFGVGYKHVFADQQSDDPEAKQSRETLAAGERRGDSLQMPTSTTTPSKAKTTRRKPARKPAARKTARAKAARTRASHQTGAAIRQSQTATRETTDAFGDYAERAVLIPVGAALVARDRVVSTVSGAFSTYSSSSKTQAQLRRFERRGA